MPRMAQYRGKWLLIASKVKPFPRPGKRNNWSSQSFAWLTLGLVIAHGPSAHDINVLAGVEQRSPRKDEF